MTVVRTLRALVLGETWWLPCGVAVVLAVGLLGRALVPGPWADAGAFVLLAAVVALLVSSVRRDTR
jgi:hypothetical protein